MSEKSTKKVRVSDSDILRPEYRREDLGKGTRGKYYKVNSALRSLMEVAGRVRSPNKPIVRKTRSG